MMLEVVLQLHRLGEGALSSWVWGQRPQAVSRCPGGKALEGAAWGLRLLLALRARRWEVFLSRYLCYCNSPTGLKVFPL